jgi:hypothetical protein
MQLPPWLPKCLNSSNNDDVDTTKASILTYRSRTTKIIIIRLKCDSSMMSSIPCLPATTCNISYYAINAKFYLRCHFVQRGSTFCFVFLLLVLLGESLVKTQNTAVFANFVQFHHASPAVDRQLITRFVTRPGRFASFLILTDHSLGRHKFASLFYSQYQTILRFSVLP